MIKIKPVPFSLSVSAVSFLLFIGFGSFVNHYSESYERKIKEVKREQGFAAERLQMAHSEIQRQKRRADSLQVVAEASSREEILWTARALYSETHRTEEMWYVGWVIRNRFESGFRGESYKSVILHPKQFSAFNKGNPKRDYYLSLEPTDAFQNGTWHDALQVAKTVVDAPLVYNPLPKDTFFFYSERSMEGRRHPVWRYNLTQVGVDGIENRRFRFLRGSQYSQTTATAR